MSRRSSYSQRRAQHLDRGVGAPEREFEQADARASGRLVVAEIEQDRMSLFRMCTALAFMAEHRLDPRKDSEGLGLLRPLTDGAHQPDALGGRGACRPEITGAGFGKRKHLRFDAGCTQDAHSARAPHCFLEQCGLPDTRLAHEDERGAPSALDRGE
jgi:hypothetical protein